MVNRILTVFFPLTDKDSGIIFSKKNVDKDTLFNKQFQSVYSQQSHVKLSQLCIDKIQGYLSARKPKRFQCSYRNKPEINIDLKGILKLLSNLKPDKAPGPRWN